MQFALHYMFSDKVTLHNFLVNVSNNVKQNGYFIGTCYDGKAIYDILKDVDVDDKIEKYVNKTHKIWHVAKKYNEEHHDFDNDDDSSLGMKMHGSWLQNAMGPTTGKVMEKRLLWQLSVRLSKLAHLCNGIKASVATTEIELLVYQNFYSMILPSGVTDVMSMSNP